MKQLGSSCQCRAAGPACLPENPPPTHRCATLHCGRCAVVARRRPWNVRARQRAPDQLIALVAHGRAPGHVRWRREQPQDSRASPLGDNDDPVGSSQREMRSAELGDQNRARTRIKVGSRAVGIDELRGELACDYDLWCARGIISRPALRWRI